MFWCIRENVRWLRADIGPRPIVLLVLDLAVFALLAHWLRAAAQRLKESGRIVPYFKKPKSRNTSKETFAAGAAISAHCESLDSLAAQRGLVPISQFGFKDDRLWQTVKWHDPEEGLRSVTGLIAA
jgi:hypothetical protein